MSKHGYRHVRKTSDGRPKPYFGRISFAGEEFQTKGFATAIEAHQAALELLALKQTAGDHDDTHGDARRQ
jgi:hypothetical protein